MRGEGVYPLTQSVATMYHKRFVSMKSHHRKWLQIQFLGHAFHRKKVMLFQTSLGAFQKRKEVQFKGSLLVQ